MRGLKRFIENFKNAINVMTNGNDLFQYDVILGIVSSFMIGIIELVSYFLVPAESVSSNYIFLLASGLMFMQLIFFLTVYQNRDKVKYRLVKFIIKLHPFLILYIGLAVTFMHQNYSNQIDSFLIAVFAVSMIQLYPAKRRITLFGFAIVAFSLVMYLTHGFNTVFFQSLRPAAMVFILGYLYTWIQYGSNMNRHHLMTTLEETNRIQEASLEKLKNTFDDLDQSHKITEAMMVVTTEMLKNDRFDDVLQMILDEAIRILPKAQAGSILIYNGEVMEYRAAVGYSLANLQKITLKVEELFQSTFADMYEPAIIEDLRVFDEAHLSDDLVKELRSQEALVAQAVLTCSFKHNGQFFGLINLDNYDKKLAYDESDKRLIKHLARQIEISIAIHMLYGKAVKQTRYDELTLANTRRYHLELINKAYEDALNNKTPLSICSIDINNLKDINDRFGHDAGDQCLKYFSDMVRKGKADQCFFSRVGGDEFFLVYPQTNSIEAHIRIAELRMKLAEKPFFYHSTTQIVKFGCGIASYPEDGTELEELIKLCDTRMYENKIKIKQGIE